MPKHRPRSRDKQDRRNSPKSARARRAALEVLSLMRAEGKSLTAAIREAHTTRQTVVRYVASALTKGSSGRYGAKPSDRFARDLHFLTPEGQVAITVRSSRTASKIAEYMAAVDHYLKTGNTTRLDNFRGKSVKTGKLTLAFVTDPRTLDRLANAGQVAFEDLYAISS